MTMGRYHPKLDLLCYSYNDDDYDDDDDDDDSVVEGEGYSSIV